MRILVTGGSGFIGSALCPHLRAQGHEIVVLTRDIRATSRRMPDVRAIGHLGDAGDVDAVINLAGEPLTNGRWTARRKQMFRDSRLGTTRALIDWIAASTRRPHVLVSGSALGYYGPRDDDIALDESAPPGDDFGAALNRDWEAEAQGAQALGLRVVLVRSGIVLDHDGGALAKMLPAFRLGAGGAMGDGRQWMSWIAREDHVRLVAWLLARDDAQGAYNVTAPAPVRNREFADTLAATLHRPALLTMPAPVLRLLFGEMAGLLLGGQRVLPARAQAEGFAFMHPTLAQALRAILR
jgi:uncharacterized protein (TIGR01777 family)